MSFGNETDAAGRTAPLRIRPLKLNFALSSVRLWLNLLLPLVTFPYISRVLGPESLGRVEFANSIVSYFVLFAALGIPTYGIREIARVRDDAEERSRTVFELGAVLLVTISVSYAAYFLLVNSVPRLKAELALFLIVAPTVFLSDFSFEWFYGGIEDQLYITVRYLAVKALQVAAVFLLVKGEDGLYIYAAIHVGLSSVSTIFNLVRLRKYQVRVPLRSLNLGRHLRPAFCIFAAQVAVSVYAHFDVTMLGIIRTKEDVGIYTAANRIVRLVISVVTSLSAVIVPRIENALKKGDFDGYRHYLEKSLRFTLILALPFFAGVEIVADDAIPVFAGEKYSAAVFSVRILSPVILIVPLANFTGLQVLFANRMERIYTLAVSVAAAVNFIVNLTLIPRFGLDGAIAGTLVAESVGLLIMTAAGRKILCEAGLRVQCWKYLLASAVMAAAVCAAKSLCAGFPVSARLAVSVAAGAAVYAACLIAVREKMILELAGKGTFKRGAQTVRRV